MKPERGKILVLHPSDQESPFLRDFLNNSIWETDYLELDSLSGLEMTKHGCDLMIVNLQGNEKPGLEMIQNLRKNYSKLEFPIIAFGVSEGSTPLERALEYGVNDFANSSTNEQLLNSRILTHITLREQQEKRYAIDQYDELTGLLNKEELIVNLRREAQRSLRYENPVSFVLLGIDKFDQLVESYGDSVGNEILRSLGDTLKRDLRFSDLAGRYEDEVISIILPQTDRKGAKYCLLRLQEAIGRINLETETRDSVELTASAGVVVLLDGYDGIEPIVNRAEELREVAKNKKPNSICFDRLS